MSKAGISIEIARDFKIYQSAKTSYVIITVRFNIKFR